MQDQRIMTWLRVGMIALCLAVLVAPAAGSVQAQSYYFEDFDDQQAQGWEMEPGWQIVEDEGIRTTKVNYVLRGTGHQWATYSEGGWQDFYLSFFVRLMEEGSVIHIVWRMGSEGRYFMGFSESGLYLSKEAPWGTFENLEDFQTEFLVGDWHQVEVYGSGGYMEVRVDGGFYFRYEDANPLPFGTIAFETLDGAVVDIDDVTVEGFQEPEGVADLAVLSANEWWLEEDGAVVKVAVLVVNQGNVSSPETDIYFGIPDLNWSAPYAYLRDLEPGEEEWVELSLYVPDEYRGQNYQFMVELDPDGRVEEPDHGNNITWTPEVSLPGLGEPPPPEPPRETEEPVPPPGRPTPDLAIRSVEHLGYEEGSIYIGFWFEVENQGDARSSAAGFGIYAEDDTTIAEWTSVPALDPGETYNDELWLELPDSWRGTDRRIAAEIDLRGQADQNLTNNRRAASYVIPTGSYNGSAGFPWGLLLGGAVLLIGGVVTVRATARARLRRKWEQQAKKGQPEGECQPPSKYCEVETEFDFRRLRVTELNLVTSDPQDSSRRSASTIKGKVPVVLEKAIRARLRGAGQDSIAEHIGSTAADLAPAIIRFLSRETGPCLLTVSAHLEGIEVDMIYTLFTCVRKGRGTVWKPGLKWRVKKKQELDETITELSAIDPGDVTLRDRLPGLLMPGLTDYVARYRMQRL